MTWWSTKSMNRFDLVGLSLFMWWENHCESFRVFDDYGMDCMAEQLWAIREGLAEKPIHPGEER